MNVFLPHPNPRARPTAFGRALWGLLGAAALAFGIFEMVAHGQPTILAGIAGLVFPDLALLIGTRTPTQRGQLARPSVVPYNMVHSWLFPALLLVGFALSPWTNVEVAPVFTAGLAWLAHIAIDRASGYGPRTADGWRRWDTRNRQEGGAHDELHIERI